MQKTLVGKTLFITGGSRGIGQAIATRFAESGANIVIISNEQSIQNSTTDKIMTLNVDVRNAEAIHSTVEKVIAHFGCIDIVINNVSAFCFTDTLNTKPDQFDQLFTVNVRATFLISRACLNYLKQSKNPHIINVSPPLDMDSKWFKNHLAFTMSKYGMSMCTLGMAAEFQDQGIAVNSLWPLTTIATTTIKDHFLPEVYAGSRWPTIMADAAFELAQKNSKKCNGQFFIDELLLREAGVTDFSQYAVDRNSPLMQDLYIPNQVLQEMPNLQMLDYNNYQIAKNK